MPNPLEEMFLPCPEDLCDGSGMVYNEETGLEDMCPCKKETVGAEDSADFERI